MKIGVQGNKYSLAIKNERNPNDTTYYVGILLDEDEFLIKILDKFGVERIIAKSNILRMKLFTEGVVHE